MKKKILMIDDDRVLCEEFKDILEDNGYIVHSESNGSSGKMAIDKEHFDLLILDLKMPGLSGFEILETLRASGSLVKIIVLTGRPLKDSGNLADFNAYEEALLESADEVMNKASAIEDVLIKISELVGC